MDFKTSHKFKDFLKLYSDNPERVIFFVGAGLSMPLFPNWASFLKELVNEVASKDKLLYDKEELINKIDNGTDFLAIANYCADAIGKSEYREIIEKNFDKDFMYDEVPEAYKLLLTLPFKSIITTNYDRIPEIGGRGNLSCYTNKNISESLKAIEKGKKIVLKVHGDILNQDSIILTESDFKTIIHNDSAVRHALASLFSTSTVCFLGFGMTDPHFNLILDYLHTINNGKTVIHYAFLASKSKFEIESLERSKGIRIIEYLPSDNMHIETLEFIQELKGEKQNKLDVKTKIENLDYLLVLLKNKLEIDLSLFKYYLNFNEEDKKIVINYFSRANSEHEQQREIISLLKLFDFETSLINELKICCFVETPAQIEFVKSSPIILVINCNYKAAYEFSHGKVSPHELWKKLRFNQPYNVGNITFTDREVIFPFINFLV